MKGISIGLFILLALNIRAADSIVYCKKIDFATLKAEGIISKKERKKAGNYFQIIYSRSGQIKNITMFHKKYGVNKLNFFIRDSCLAYYTPISQDPFTKESSIGCVIISDNRKYVIGLKSNSVKPKYTSLDSGIIKTIYIYSYDKKDEINYSCYYFESDSIKYRNFEKCLSDTVCPTKKLTGKYIKSPDGYSDVGKVFYFNQCAIVEDKQRQMSYRDDGRFWWYTFFE